MKNFICFILALGLTGCQTYQNYDIQPQGPTAQIDLSSLPDPWICIHSTRLSVKSPKAGLVTIPAGSRITVGSIFTWQGYNVTYSCDPSMSFIPVEGESYYVHGEIIAEACSTQVFVKSDKNRVGLDLVETIARGTCSR
ncbi:MAG: hypothetical protein ACK4VV_15280 [Pseudomonas sp.]